MSEMSGKQYFDIFREKEEIHNVLNIHIAIPEIFSPTFHR
jgi:hypothetical protein